MAVASATRSTLDAAPQQRLELERPLGRGDGRHRQQLVVGRAPRTGPRPASQLSPRRPVSSERSALLEALGERAPDGHRLAHALHRRAEDAGGAGQLLEGPARDLRDHVVDGGLEAGRRLAGDVVGDLVERVADGQAGGDLGDREAGGLAGQRARARHARVHLDHDLLAGAGVDGELHVAAAGLDADAPDAGEGGVAHLLVLDVGQRLGRRHGDGVAGVHAHRVEVLDRADDDAVVGPVAHHLQLELLPPGDGATR